MAFFYFSGEYILVPLYEIIFCLFHSQNNQFCTIASRSRHKFPRLYFPQFCHFDRYGFWQLFLFVCFGCFVDVVFDIKLSESPYIAIQPFFFITSKNKAISLCEDGDDDLGKANSSSTFFPLKPSYSRRKYLIANMKVPALLPTLLILQ